ncbi:hypothetical protein ACSNOI_23600 [Actinomadura kijaniata]|uniref:hypothetical protein n=1 Tax=Actinomadura kijaniata TaxID=46161 RepID=UPI003F1A9C05
MRRLLATAGSLLLTLPLLPQGTALAHQDVAILEVIAPRAGTTAQVTRPQIRAASPAGIAKVTVKLRLRGEERPYATADATVRVDSAPETNGRWSTESALPLKEGRTVVDVEVTDRDGDRAVRTDATEVVTGLLAVGQVQAETADGYWMRMFDRPFRVEATISHDRPIARFEARLYRAGTDDPVSEVLPLRSTHTADRFSIHQSDLLDPPVGDYELVATAWDDQGQRSERRSGVIRKRLPARMVDLSQDRDWYDVDHGEITVTGRLVHVAADGSRQPLADARVFDDNDPKAETRTDADGRFALTVRVGQVSPVRIAYFGKGPYGDAGAIVTANLRRLPVRVDVRHTPVRQVGDRTTVSGLAEARNSDGKWVPLADHPVRIHFRDGSVRLVAEARTGSDGRYSLQTTVPSTGAWTVSVNEGSENRFYGSANDTTPVQSVTNPTTIDGVSFGPNPISPDTPLAVTGRVSRPKSSGENTAAVGAFVDLQFSADGKKWVTRAGGVTREQGRFGTQAKVTQDGYWRIRYAGGTGGNASPGTPDAASVSAAKWIDMRYRTAVRDFNATPEPVRKGGTLTLNGNVVRDLGKGWKAAGKGTKVTLYFQARGSTKWTAVTTTTTDAKGAFRKAVKASKDGTWRAAYAGGSSYLASISTGDYVDVK